MPFTKLEAIEPREAIAGFHGRFYHSEFMTFVQWEIEAGARLPEHSHPHEQVANVLEGRFELAIAGETQVMAAGGVGVIPPNALHSGRALTPCRIIDVFYPIREDYR